MCPQQRQQQQQQSHEHGSIVSWHLRLMLCSSVVILALVVIMQHIPTFLPPKAGSDGGGGFASPKVALLPAEEMSSPLDAALHLGDASFGSDGKKDHPSSLEAAVSEDQEGAGERAKEDLQSIAKRSAAVSTGE